ncbi:hypothetical protein AAIR98_000914 [Elusimicrobium simillimum]|uniref:hypothetical protein n=1 Tax=Elusimicrobium simillimum TaxID=3143438 RepID=UPI003C6FAE8F
MIHRSLDANGDWVFGKGRNSYTRSTEAIMLNIKTRLLSFRNDCFFDLDAGVDWWNLLGSKKKETLLFQIRSVIADSYGVSSIESFDSTFSQDRTLSVTYSIKTVNGDIDTDTTEIIKYA